MYNQHLLARVIALTDIASYLVLPPSPREIMRKGVFLGVGNCYSLLYPCVDRREFRRERERVGVESRGE